MNANMAFQLLQLANAHSGQTTEDIVARAKAFGAFVEGRGEVAGDEPVQVPVFSAVPANEPGVKRVRRTKEQMEAERALLAETVKDAAPMSAPQAAVKKAAEDPVLAYKDLQAAMIKLVGAKGNAAGAAVLAQFGIKAPPGTARELQPEQYAECTMLLKEALKEGSGGLA